MLDLSAKIDETLEQADTQAHDRDDNKQEQDFIAGGSDNTKEITHPYDRGGDDLPNIQQNSFHETYLLSFKNCETGRGYILTGTQHR